MARGLLPAGAALCLAIAALPARGQDSPNPGSALEELDRAAQAVVESRAPAVVRVEAERPAQVRVLAPSADERRLLEERIHRYGARERVGATGFVVEEVGWVVTASAAASGAERLRVTFEQGAVREAEVVGEDPITGVALLRIEPVPGVVPLRLSAREPRPGALSLLLAPQEGSRAALHFGFVTDPRRAFGRYDAWLVSSVPVAPGHAGAPLLDARGEVLGIAVAARGRVSRPLPAAPGEGGAFRGPGGAWPVTAGRVVAVAAVSEGPAPFSTFVAAPELRRIVEDLRTLGRVRRAMLGVILPREEPVVERVLEGTPAARAGVAPGDRLLDLDGVPVEDADAVTGFIQRRAPGTEVRLRLRGPDGTERDARVRLGELAAQPRLLFNGLGVQERESFDTSAARFAVAGVPGGRRVVVSSVDEGCSAACAGIRAGDWIVEIAGTPVLSASDYGRLATDACAVAECVEVTVYRAGEEQRRKVVLK